MSVTVILPAPPGPYLETGLLPGDFYAYEELLSDKEREKVESVREFFRTQLAPIVDDYWARAEFPFQLVEGCAKLRLLDWADPALSEPKPSNLFEGVIALEFAHADPSVATFFGVHAGLAMGSILTCGSEEQQRRWLPAMCRFQKIGALR
jgi:glutaryl-CoA dehydrogenase